jgi:hypothetical protein
MLRLKKHDIIKQLPLLAALFYAVAITVAVLLTGSTVLAQIHYYLNDAVSLWAAIFLMTRAMRDHNKTYILYTALGMCCLVLGDLYFVLLDIVSFSYDEISVGLFAKVCCYLFFIAVLSAQKPFKLKRVAAVDIGSFAIAATCAYAVIANSYLVINLSVFLLNLLCAVLAIGLLRYPARSKPFAYAMLFLAVKDILSVFSVLSFPTDSLSPLLCLLIVRSIVILDEEVEYAE